MEDLLDGLFPAEISASAGAIEDWTGELLPEERLSIGKAVESRRSEFATGRKLARQLLGECGHPNFPLLREDRLPCWPGGIIGSITHTRNRSGSRSLCVAAVGHASRFAGIGIDCEPDEPVDQGIERVVCRGDEHAWVGEGVGDERGRRCRVVFSIKEAVYKAFFPRTRVFWSFQDVTVSIDLERGVYSARLPESAGVERVEGRIRRRDGWILSATVVG